MSVALASLSIFVGAVLAWSGTVKARDPQSVAAAMMQLRVPDRLAGRTMRRLLPWGELLLAAVLVLAHGALLLLAWTATLVLFLVYLALVARAARQPESVSCNCFGSTAAPVTTWTVARNVLLATGAAVGWTCAVVNTVGGGSEYAGLRADAWLAISIVSLIGATAFVLGVDLGNAARGESRPGVPTVTRPVLHAGRAADEWTEQSEAEGVETEYVRQPIPAAVVEVALGEQRLLAELANNAAVVLVYLSATCSPCLEIAEKLPQWAERLQALDFVVVAYNQNELALLASRVPGRAVTDVAGSVQTALRMNAVPSAAILGADGRLAGGPVTGTEDIDHMMQELLEQFAEVGEERGADTQLPRRG